MRRFRSRNRDGADARAAGCGPYPCDSSLPQGAYSQQSVDIRRSLRPYAPALVPGLLAIALTLVWAEHDGGYNADTWYWGALVLVGLFAVVAMAFGFGRLRSDRLATVALAAFAMYVAWSYLSIAWAQSPGDALQGSNRALLYLLVFAVMLAVPWQAPAALVALVTFVVGVGVIAFALLFQLASADHVGNLIIGGRLESPTGYFNSTAALFMIDALMATSLAARRELPGPLRGLLVAIACAALQLTLIVESRGWLFTLPLVLIVALVLVRDRLRVALAGALPVLATLVSLHRLLAVYKSSGGAGLAHAAKNAGEASLVLCALVVVIGTLVAWVDQLGLIPSLSRVRRRQVAVLATVIAIAGGCAGALVATKGHPVAFVSRQWNGFVRSSTETVSTSNFGVVGSGRYDFWRVAVDAFLAHPIGGLGQDNFDNYYVPRRRTDEEPAWTHSLEMRLLAHTGIVGFGLFAAFLVAALMAALRARRRPVGRGDLTQAVAGIALLPLVVWVIHGSIDWFWEIPALSGPALGFLAMAAALSGSGARELSTSPEPGSAVPPSSGRSRRGIAVGALGVAALLAAVIVLGFPYLSVREVSAASDVRQANPAQALVDLATASKLNPLGADPGRIGGTIALQTGQYAQALSRFEQSISRDPGGWYAWFGAGLSASALQNRELAHRDLQMAASINPREPVIQEALGHVNGAHPLTPAAALRMLVVVQ